MKTIPQHVCGKICRVGLYTELFYTIIPTLFLCFLLICYPYTFLMFFILVMYIGVPPAIAIADKDSDFESS